MESGKSLAMNLPAKVSECLQDMYHRAREQLREKGSLMPVIFYMRYDASADKIAGLTVTGIPMFETEETKDMAAMIMRQMGYRVRANYCFSFLESWIATGDKVNGAYCPPSRHPSRKEVVVVMVQTKGNHSWLMSQEIDRSSGQPVIPETLNLEDSHDGTVGRFANILDYEPENPSAFELGLTDIPDIPGVHMTSLNDGDGKE